MNAKAQASALLTPAPWDAAAFGQPAWDVAEYTPEALALADATPGIQSIKVDPLADKRLLQQHGFYYADTLLATVAGPAQLRPLTAPPGVRVLGPDDAGFDAAFDADAALAICHGAFRHGRYHRDLHLDQDGAARRYDNWLRQLIAARAVYGLYHGDELAGFIGAVHSAAGSTLVLHAVAPAWRGRGLAKHWWHQTVARLFAAGHGQVASSVSAANVAVLNLYASLGFSFRNPLDVYQRIVCKEGQQA